MIKKILLLSVVMLMLFGMPGFAQTQETIKIYFYVSPTGNDQNSGTIDAPLKTFKGARDAIRSLKNTKGLPNGEIVVYFREGIYQNTETITLDSQDSGSENCRITYSAYPGEHASISAGYYIEPSSFQNVADRSVLNRLSYSAKRNVRTVDLKKMGITDYGFLSQAGDQLQSDSDGIYGMQVYVGDSVYDLARYPNRDTDGISQYVQTKNIINGQNAYSVGKNSDKISKFTVYNDTAERMKTWATYDDVWCEGSFNWVYFCASLPIDSVDFTSNAISVRGGAFGGFAQDKPFYFINVLEELDTEGEYYIDRDNGILYIYPDENFDSGDVVKLSGDCGFYLLELKDGANYINFNGLTFELSRKHCASIDKCSYINVTNCFFGNSTGMGLFIGECTGWGHSSPRAEGLYTDEELGLDTHDINVINCTFENTGDGGVRAAAGNHRTLTPGNIKIMNCHTRRCDVSNKTYAPGIGAWGCGIEVRNNLVEYQSHAGILHGGAEITFANNELKNVLREYADMGAFYTSKSAITVVYKNNYIHDIPFGEIRTSMGKDGEYHRMLDSSNMFCMNKYGIYIDGSAPGGTMINNVVENCTYGVVESSWGLVCEENIFNNVYFPFSISNNVSVRGAKEKGINWYDTNAQTFWRLIGSGQLPAWEEKYPETLKEYNRINNNFLEKSTAEFESNNAQVNNNLIIYTPYGNRALMEFRDQKARFGDLNLFNKYVKNDRTYWMEAQTSPFPSFEIGGGSFKNNQTVNYDIGFKDYKKHDLTLKEDAEILKTNPGLSKIKMNEISVVDNSLSERTEGAYVFEVGSPKAYINSQEKILDESNVEIVTVEKDSKAYITSKSASEIFKVDFGENGVVSLNDIAEKTGKKLYKSKNGIYILYNGDTEIFSDSEYDNILLTVLKAKLQ